MSADGQRVESITNTASAGAVIAEWPLAQDSVNVYMELTLDQPANRYSTRFDIHRSAMGLQESLLALE